MLKELIKIANELDRRGLTNEADDIDEALKQYLDRGGAIERKEEGKGLSDYGFLRRQQKREKEKMKAEWKEKGWGSPDDEVFDHNAPEGKVKDFVLNNFINIKDEYSEEFQDIEDLYQSSGDSYGHQSLVEYFDSILERLEIIIDEEIDGLHATPRGDIEHAWLSQIYDILIDYAEENRSKVTSEVAWFFLQHVRRIESLGIGPAPI